MAYGTRVNFETLREVAFGSIGAAYSAVGSAIANHARLIKVTNGTNAPVYFSIDGVEDHDKIPANGFALYDLSTNKIRDDGLFLPIGTTFYVKYDTAPTSGAFWIAVIYAEGGV